MLSKRSLITILIVFIISGCTSDPITTSQSILTIRTESGKVNINVEISDTGQKIQQGLMYRESLDEDSGMLFIFQNEKPVSFWMKNTKIPLDMMFVSADGIINEIKVNVQPCLSDPCTTYPSKHPTKYVIEVNAGFSEKSNIQVGDRLDLTTLKN